MFAVPAQLDESPGLSTTAHWRDLLRAERKSQGYTQRTLAARVGISQNVLSMIESGRLKSSKAILRICDVLKIPPPAALYADELEQRWMEAGGKLRVLEPRMFGVQLETVENMIAMFRRGPSTH